MNYIVITSINDLTKAVEDFSKQENSHVIIVGDKKSIQYKYENVTYLNIHDQIKLSFNSIKTTPYNHYSRKNIGYLYAIQNGAETIYDTDDDTIPYKNWKIRDFMCDKLIKGSVNINAYKLFTNQKVWPRGLNLSAINKNEKFEESTHNCKIGVWQGVIDGDSDFDAIYRLTVNEHIIFDKKQDVAIDRNCYAPFNTQSTLWNNELYCLMYIPISVDFRFTDILRGYIAQRVMWDYGYKLGFHSANTYQVRNEHDYYKDFIGELSMYQQVPIVIDILQSIKLMNKNIQEDLVRIYQILCDYNVVRKCELDNLSNWINDLNQIQ